MKVTLFFNRFEKKEGVEIDTQHGKIYDKVEIRAEIPDGDYENFSQLQKRFTEQYSNYLYLYHLYALRNDETKLLSFNDIAGGYENAFNLDFSQYNEENQKFLPQTVGADCTGGITEPEKYGLMPAIIGKRKQIKVLYCTGKIDYDYSIPIIDSLLKESNVSQREHDFLTQYQPKLNITLFGFIKSV